MSARLWICGAIALALAVPSAAGHYGVWHAPGSPAGSNPPPPPASDGFEVVHEWKFLDFEYPSYEQRRRAIAERSYVPENNLPLGIDAFEDRLFVTTPRWKDGVPASLGTLPWPQAERSPPLRPYPDWAAHADPYRPDCDKLVSVYRTAVDACGRLWAIDSGIVNATISLNQLCPPKIVAFDLRDGDKLLVRHQLPADLVKQDSLHSNIVVDVAADECGDAHVYVTDVWRFGVVVYSLAKNRSWRVTNFHFSANPAAADFNVYGLNFQWLDGVFGLSLSCRSRPCSVYFHPMASTKEFMVSAAVLRDESLWSGGFPPQNVSRLFREVGDRGPLSQSSTAGITRHGVQVFTQVARDAIACWDTAKPYLRANIGLIRPSNSSLIQFPNDLKVDRGERQQSVWLMSNRLPIYLYGQLDFGEINFRILRADIDAIIAGSVCDPRQHGSQEPQYEAVYEGQCL